MVAKDGTALAGLVLTGDEIVEGSEEDQNACWIADRLTGLGFEMVGHKVVRDRSAELAKALRDLAAERVDLIVNVAGMGTTPDDHSRQELALFTGRALTTDASLAEYLNRLPIPDSYEERSVWLEGIREQARVPAGASVVMPVVTAPAIALRALSIRGADAVTVAGLPGPPEEVRALFDDLLKTPPMRALLARVVAPQRRIIRLVTTGDVDETSLGETVRIAKQTLPIGELDIRTCVKSGGAELSLVTVFPPASESAYAAFEALVLQRHGHKVFSVDGLTVDDIDRTLAGERSIGILDAANGPWIASRVKAAIAKTQRYEGDLRDMSRLLTRLGAPLSATPTGAELAARARDILETDIGIGVVLIEGTEGALEVAILEVGAGPVVTRRLQLPREPDEVNERTPTQVMHLLKKVLEQRPFGR